MFEGIGATEAERLGVDCSEGFLFDTMALPGLVRKLATLREGDQRFRLIQDLKLLLSAHGIEVIFLLEHTNCAEREHSCGKAESRAETVGRITGTLLQAAERLTEDLKSIRDLQIVPLVAIVNEHTDSRRRCEAIVHVDTYISHAGIISIMNQSAA